MKKIAIAMVVVLILAGIIWFLIPKTRSNDEQKPGNPKPHAAVIQKPAVVTPASHKVEKSGTQNQPQQPAITTSADATVVDVIAGGGALETNAFKDSFIKRCRPIAISPQMIEKAGKLAPGSKLSLELFPDAKYSVTLQTVNRSPQGDLSIGGKLDGEEYGTFILSTGGGVVLARLADPQSRKLFLIRYRMQNHSEYAVEVDVEKTPVPGHISPSGNISNASKQ